MTVEVLFYLFFTMGAKMFLKKEYVLWMNKKIPAL